jgi:hypothetical protein
MPTSTKRLLKTAHLRRCASYFVIAAYEKIRLIPQDSRALHLDIFEQPSKQAIRSLIKRYLHGRD